MHPLMNSFADPHSKNACADREQNKRKQNQAHQMFIRNTRCVRVGMGRGDGAALPMTTGGEGRGARGGEGNVGGNLPMGMRWGGENVLRV